MKPIISTSYPFPLLPFLAILPTGIQPNAPYTIMTSYTIEAVKEDMQTTQNQALELITQLRKELFTLQQQKSEVERTSH